jgi:hypothetical protein
MNLLRAWLFGTALFICGWAIWVFAPILVPAILVTVGLGLIVAVIVQGARRLERWRGTPPPPG